MWFYLIQNISFYAPVSLNFFFNYKKEKKKGLPDVVIDSLLPAYLNSTHDLGSLVQ